MEGQDVDRNSVVNRIFKKWDESVEWIFLAQDGCK